MCVRVVVMVRLDKAFAYRYLNAPGQRQWRRVKAPLICVI